MTNFSIGELSNLTGVSIQTLRFYDRINLFKPIYIDPSNNYRYYDIKQIFRLNTIKYLRFIDFSIQQIQQMMSSSTPEQITFLEQQETAIDHKIQELRQIKQLVRGQQQQLELKQFLTDNKLGTTYQRLIDDTYIAKIDCQTPLTPLDYPDVSFSQLAKNVRDSGTIANLQYGCAYQFKDYQSTQSVQYQFIFTQVFDDILKLPQSNKQIIPAGNYLCIAFKWSREDYLVYLQKLINTYQNLNGNKNNLIYEISLANGYDYQTAEDFITELRILLSTKKSE